MSSEFSISDNTVCKPVPGRLGARVRRTTVLVGIAVVALLAGGCGGGASSQPKTSSAPAATSSTASVPLSTGSIITPSATGAVAAPNAVVVRVAGHAITGAAFAHAFAAVVKQEGISGVGMVPPAFSGCIAELKKTQAAADKMSVATLRAECHRQYLVIETHALDSLILAQWLSGGAGEVGASVSPAAVQAQLEKEQHNEGAQFATSLASTGRTISDIKVEIRVQLLAEAIRQALAAKAAQISEAQVASYYNQNKAAFGTPEKRVLEIARTATAAAGRKVKREIASGKSIAAVVKAIKLSQPIFSSNGVVSGYVSGMYHEPGLNRAITTAKPHALSGPFPVPALGYYVFEVTKIIPATQKTLAESRPLIKQQLPSIRYEQALEAFVSRWRQRWTAMTECQPGYVVAKCRGYTSPVGTLPQGPRSLE